MRYFEKTANYLEKVYAMTRTIFQTKTVNYMELVCGLCLFKQRKVDILKKKVRQDLFCTLDTSRQPYIPYEVIVLKLA